MTSRHLDLDPQSLGKLPFLRHGLGARALMRYERIDRAIVGFLERNGVTLLRFALGAVFVWFGLLKVIDRSPVADLVAETIPFVSGAWVVPALGGVEIVIGLGLLLGVGMRLVLLVFFLQMAGTFLVLLTKPGESFQDGNPFLLTVLGEFVIKNLVLIAAGLVVGSRVRSRDEAIPASEAA